ncbi:calpain-1 catalytic subunit-like isoform X2 [Xyrichtys novacula]|uniref:Calpain-1 catalytic subunit-like isoform X2 n=1 Tax=Xyrichtys novacula TaxID=13765 RepID=A0AAV1EYT7_XYRNO|nr:calpain-1 catalytic subunit-like isoform X2 [Xyrichtys novacula]
MLSSMTSYQPSMGNSSLRNLKTQMSSGLLCSRKPMQSGSPTEALMDFTGGIFMSARLSPKPPPDLWELMFKAAKSNSMMCCSSKPGKTAGNAELPCGVVTGHAYGITSVDQLISQVGTVRLVRMLNPWGEGEWKGDWSDKSPCWQTVSPQDREKCLCVAENGEFWMALEDLCRLYSRVDICCQCPSFLDGSSECHWKTSIHEGRWVTGSTAGGAQNSATFWTNPQYRVKVEKLSDDCSATQGEYNMLVCLMQKPDKRNRRMVKNLFLGFVIYEVPKEYQGKKLPASFFKRRYIAAVDKYRNKREVMARVALKPGEYVIVPCTSEPDETASFILIIVSKVETHVDEDSCDDNYERIEGEEPTPDKEEEDQENKKTLVHQLSGQYEATDADLLQGILNGKLLKGNLKTGGFSIEACRSMVALLDTKQTGKLTNEEFACLWNKVSMFQDVFSQADVSQKGTLSLKELQSALQASGKKISDDIFNILALRYVSSSGQMTLETFICMALRLDYMIQVFRQLRKGMTLTLRKRDWLYLSMYS